jgi:hypothetical protein
MDVRPGRDEALSRLFEAHYADTVRLAFFLTGSWTVAEDLAQEAFVRLWRRAACRSAPARGAAANDTRGPADASYPRLPGRQGSVLMASPPRFLRP